MGNGLTAADVRACLALRWADSDYLSIEEAPEDSSRSGRKIDLLVIALWRSRGLERDAVEIKTSMSDWKREREHAAKADFWWRHSHRFWLAVPADMAPRARDELPATWGLLACTPGKTPVVVVKPKRREAEPLSWQTTVGVMRAAANCGVNAIRRAEDRGYENGRKAGLREAEHASPDGWAKKQLEDLHANVKAFEEASGVRISDKWEAGPVGEIVALIRKEFWNPGHTLEAVAAAAGRVEQVAGEIANKAQQARKLAALIAEHSPRRNGKETPDAT